MLLVIDDVWRIEDALAFKVGGSYCAYLVTTRFPNISLQFASEGATVVRELSENEGVELLSRLAPQVVQNDPKIAHILVQSVGALPLALTIIGHYLRTQSHSGQSRRLRAAIERLQNVEERLRLSEPLALLERSPNLSQETPLSLQAVIEVGDHYLDEQAKSTLRALSIFPAKPNSFSEEAALAVSGASVEALDTLTDVGFLEGSGPDRYTLHQTIADYARSHLSDVNVYQRMAEYFVCYVEAHQNDYKSLEQEINNIFAALVIAFKQGLHVLLIRGVNAFYPFLETQGLYGQAEEHLKRAQQAALTLHDDLSLSEVLLHLGKVVGKQTDYLRAEGYLQEGLALARRHDHKELISALLQALSSIAYRQGDNTKTVFYAQEGLVLARQLGHHERIINLLKSLAAVASDLADYPQAEAYLQEGLELARQTEYAEGIRLVLTNLGWLAHQQGNYAQAEMYWQEGLALVRRIGHREGISLLLLNLGALAGDQGNYEQAEAYLQEGLILAREIGHREWISVLLANLGEYAGKQGRYSQAEMYFQESIAIARQIGHHRMLGDILSVWGELQLGRLHLDEASAAFGEALQLASDRSQVLAATALYGLAQVAAAGNNTAEAYQYGKRSLAIFEASGNYKAGEVRRWLDTLPTSSSL
jgi:tetratricopeptide (TPR) repeat protein